MLPQDGLHEADVLLGAGVPRGQGHPHCPQVAEHVGLWGQSTLWQVEDGNPKWGGGGRGANRGGGSDGCWAGECGES